MRAIRIQQPGGPEVLELIALPLPEPAPGELRVRAEAIGVGRADVLIRKGIYKWMPPLPAIPGNELAGVVEKVGPGVDSGWLGQRVLVSSRELETRGGCYCEAICVPAAAVFALPEGITAQDAVGLPNYQLALALLRSAMNPQARSILVPGAAGGVATALTQIAVARGLTVIGTVSTPQKAELARANGVSHLVSRDPVEMPQQVKALTEGRGVDIAFDHLGGASLIACLHSLAPMGMAVSYNVVLGPPASDVFQALRALLSRSLALRTFSMHTFDEDTQLRRGLLQEAIELMAAGHIQAAPATELAMEDIATAHALMDSGQSLGKIVLKP